MEHDAVGGVGVVLDQGGAAPALGWIPGIHRREIADSGLQQRQVGVQQPARGGREHELRLESVNLRIGVFVEGGAIQHPRDLQVRVIVVERREVGLQPVSQQLVLGADLEGVDEFRFEGGGRIGKFPGVEGRVETAALVAAGVGTVEQGRIAPAQLWRPVHHGPAGPLLPLLVGLAQRFSQGQVFVGSERLHDRYARGIKVEQVGGVLKRFLVPGVAQPGGELDLVGQLVIDLAEDGRGFQPVVPGGVVEAGTDPAEAVDANQASCGNGHRREHHREIVEPV